MRKLLLLFLLVFLLCAPALAAIEVDATSTGVVDHYSPASSITVAHTVSGSDRFLYVAVANHDSLTCSSATYNGDAMTEVNDQNWNVQVCAYYLIAPDTGTHDIVVTMSGSGGMTLAAVSLKGVKQDVPDDSDYDTGGGSTSLTLTTATNNSWLISGVGLNNGAGTISPGGTETKDATIGGQSTVAVGHKEIASTGSGTMTWSDGTGYEMLDIAVAVSPVGGTCNTDCSLCTSPDVPRACLGSTKPCNWTIEDGCVATAPTFITEIK